MGRRAHQPCCLGGLQRFKARDDFRSGPQVALVGTSPLQSRDPQSFKVGDKMKSGPQVGGLNTSRLLPGASQRFKEVGKNQKRATNGLDGYITHTVPKASQHGTKKKSGQQI